MRKRLSRAGAGTISSTRADVTQSRSASEATTRCWRFGIVSTLPAAGKGRRSETGFEGKLFSLLGKTSSQRGPARKASYPVPQGAFHGVPGFPRRLRDGTGMPAGPAPRVLTVGIRPGADAFQGNWR